MLKTFIHCCSLLCLSFSLFSADGSWTGAGGNLVWQNNGNWTPGPFPAGPDTATFDVNPGSDTTILLSGPLSIDTIVFDIGQFIIGGTAALTVGNLTKTTGNYAGRMNNSNTTLSNGATIEVQGTGGSSRLRFLQGPSAGGAFTKTGTGPLQFASNPTFSGPITLSGGEVRLLVGVSQLGSNSDITLADGTNLRLSGGVTTNIGSLASDGGATTATVQLDDSNTVINQSTTGTFEGVISGDAGIGITKSGTASLTLSGDNTYPGTTTVTAGTLVLSGSIDSTDIQVTGGTLELSGSTPVVGSSTITLSNSSALNTTGSSVSIGGLVGASTNTGTLSGGSTLTVTPSSSNTFAGVFSGGGALTKSGSGTLILSGDNLYTGATSVSAGTLTLGASGSGSVDSTNINVSGGTLSLASAAPVGTASTIALTSTGVMTVDAASVTVGGVTGAGASNTVTVSGSNVLTLSPTTPTTFAGVIQGTGALTKGGASLVRLSQNNTYTGATTVSAGTLVVGLSGSGSIASTDIQVSGGTLGLEASTPVPSNSTITLSSIGILNVTATSVTIGGLVGASTNSITLNGGSTLTVTPSTSNTFAGVISSGGALTKAGSGTLVLSNTNTYSGTTTVNTGTLTVSGSIASTNTDVTGGTLEITGAVNSTNLNVSGGTLSLAAASPVSTSSTIALTSTGVATVDDTTVTVGSITGAGSSNTVSLGSNTLILSPTSTHSFGGIIQGTGALTKAGSSQTTLSNANTYTGNTTVNAGTLTVSGSVASTTTNVTGGTLEITGSVNSSNLNISGGTLSLAAASPVSTSSTIALTSTGVASLGASNVTVNIITGAGASNTLSTNGNTLILNPNADHTFGGVIQGTGGLTKSGSNRTTLSGANTYTGTTQVNAGTLEISGSIDSTTINVTGGTLALSGSTPVPTSSTIALTGSGGLTLEGNATIGEVTAASSSNTISLGSNTLVLNTSSTDEYAGQISGSGSLTKTGSGTLTLSATSNYTGNTQVSAGTLAVTGNISTSSELLIASGGTLKGTGTTGTIRNQGILAPGLSIGTITIDGDYIQEAGSTLQIEIDPNGNSDLLDVSGDVTLTSTLNILPQTGTYVGGTQYTFITFTGNLSGTFTSVEEIHPRDFTVSYLANSVLFTVDSTVSVLPVAIADLRGNSQRVARYLYTNGFSATDPDLSNALSQLCSLPAALFPSGLIKISPVIYGALPLVNLQNDIRLADTVSSQFKVYCNPVLKEGEKPLCEEKGRSGMWLDPIAIYYNQANSFGRLTDEGQPAFTAYTYGLSGGYGLKCGPHITTNLGLGYTHSNIFWEQALGKGSWSSFYLAPCIDWLSEEYFWSFCFLSSYNFYKMDRNIHYSSIDRVASNHHNSYDILLQLGGGWTPQIANTPYYIQPEGQFNYLVVMQKGYKESGADSLDLEVRKLNSTFIQPNAKLRLLRPIQFKKRCLTPSIYAGWLANIPLSNGAYVSRFYQEETNQPNFETLTYREATNQLDLGANLSMENCNGFSLNFNYDVNFLSLYQIHQVKLNISWDF